MLYDEKLWNIFQFSILPETFIETFFAIFVFFFRNQLQLQLLIKVQYMHLELHLLLTFKVLLEIFYLTLLTKIAL